MYLYLLVFYLALAPGLSLAKKSTKVDFLDLAKEVQKNALYLDEDMYDRLWRYYCEPLDLNEVTTEELESFGILSSEQIRCFNNYRNNYGPFYSLYEIQVIPSWDAKTITLIKPFLQVRYSYQSQGGNNLFFGKTRFSISFAHAFGSDSLANSRLGNASRVFLNYVYDGKNFCLGGLGKKDKGELLCKPQVYWFPYWAGYMVVKEFGPLKKAIIGDYQVNIGQGLVMSSGFSLNKSAEAVYVLKTNNQEIKHTRGYARKKNFQGAAVEWADEATKIIFYVSQRSLDAKIHHRAGDSYVTSLRSRGVVYTTQRLLDQKDSVVERVLGSSLVYAPNTALALGLQAVGYKYSQRIVPQKNYYSHDLFSGDHGYNLGVFGRILWRNIHGFTELATCANGSQAMLAGAMISLGKRADLACLGRYYPADFHGLYGRAFGKNTQNRNEKGLYVGVSWRLTKKLAIKSYTDFFKHPNPQYRAWESTQGTQSLLAFVYELNRKSLYQLHIKHAQQPYNRSGKNSNKVFVLDRHRKTSLTFKFNYPLFNLLQGRTQLQLCRHAVGYKPSHYGIGGMQSMSYQKNKRKCRAYISLFDTQDYATRLYFYTPHIIPTTKYPALHGKGFSTGFSIGYRFKNNLSCQMHIASRFLYKDKVWERKPSIAFKIGVVPVMNLL